MYYVIAQLDSNISFYHKRNNYHSYDQEYPYIPFSAYGGVPTQQVTHCLIQLVYLYHLPSSSYENHRL